MTTVSKGGVPALVPYMNLLDICQDPEIILSCVAPTLAESADTSVLFLKVDQCRALGNAHSAFLPKPL